MKYLVIAYDETDAHDGDPIDLYTYLVNELNAHNINVRISDADVDDEVGRVVAV